MATCIYCCGENEPGNGRFCSDDCFESFKYAEEFEETEFEIMRSGFVFEQMLHGYVDLPTFTEIPF